MSSRSPLFLEPEAKEELANVLTYHVVPQSTDGRRSHPMAPSWRPCRATR